MIFSFIADNVTEQTAALQRAIDTATKNGEVLTVRKGIYKIGSIMIPKGAKVCLKRGAVLLGSDNIDDYENIAEFTDAVGQERGRAMVFLYHADGAYIFGNGTLDGQGASIKLKNRPFLIRIVESKNVSIKKIKIRNSCAWNLHILSSDNVTIEKVSINSRVNANNDGIDIDSSKNIFIKKCKIDTGDDGICLKTTTHDSCENIIVKRCNISSSWGAFKIGTESIGDFKNIVFKDSVIHDTDGGAIKIVPVDGAVAENIKIKNIRLKNATGPIFISLGKRLRTYFDTDTPRGIGALRNVEIKNINGSVRDAEGRKMNGSDYYVTYNGMWGDARACIVINGLREKQIENVFLKNIKLKMPGGVSEYERNVNEIIEMDEHYPEFSVLGDLPAHLAFVRHTKNVKIDRIKCKLADTDIRPAVFEVDTENFKKTIDKSKKMNYTKQNR